MPTFSCHYLSVERLPFPLIVFTSAARLSHYLCFGFLFPCMYLTSSLCMQTTFPYNARLTPRYD